MFQQEQIGELWRPRKDSHKGQNGRVLVIGGSELFHTSIFWSADVASRVVDLVHFVSPANENNAVVRTRIKEGFWSGIVVDWGEVEAYIREDDVVLIGPGMSRVEDSEITNDKTQITKQDQRSNNQMKTLLVNAGMRDDTRTIVNTLLKKYPEKRWVVDGGALQEVDPGLLNGNMIITPHLGEWERLLGKMPNSKAQISKQGQSSNDKMRNEVCKAEKFSKSYGGVTVLLKNVDGKDVVVNNEERWEIGGGNEGLTKGGTGDVLAGLVGAFYCKNPGWLAAGAASFVVKKAADELYRERGVYYNTSDLVNGVGRVMGEMMRNED